MPVRLSPLAKIFRSFFERDDAVLREALRVIKPEELAVIVNGLSAREQHQTVQLLEDAKLAEVLWNVSPHTRRRILARLSQSRVSAILAPLESDDAVDLIQMLDRRRREHIVESLRKSDPKKLLPLLGFSKKTAGGLMKTEFLRTDPGRTVEEVRRTVAASQASKSAAVYVTDAAGKLVGAVPLLRLAVAPPDAAVDGLVHAKMEAVPVGLSQEDVARHFSDVDAIELPVVDARGKLLGVITADDVLDVLQESLTEDLSRFSGTSEDEHISDPAWLSVRRRLPWLMINLGTAVLAASVVAQFQDTISELVILAALMPIVAGMGGNAVTQTLGVSIRALALNQLHPWDLWKISLRQMLAGAANGLATGSVMAGIAYAWTGNHMLALVLVIAMTTNLFIAGLGGVIIPMTMRKMNIDPALASTVFATTLTDIVGFLTFLGLARWLLT